MKKTAIVVALAAAVAALVFASASTNGWPQPPEIYSPVLKSSAGVGGVLADRDAYTVLDTLLPLVIPPPSLVLRHSRERLSVSVPGFNPERTRALVFFSYSCGSLCGGGGWLAFEVVNGRWQEAHPKDWDLRRSVS